jgi:hypothetical protein
MNILSHFKIEFALKLSLRYKHHYHNWNLLSSITTTNMSEFHPDSIRNDTDSQTLSRLVMIRTKDSDLVILLNAIQTACKLVARSVRKAGIAGLCK